MNLHSAVAFNLEDEDDEVPRQPVLQLRRPMTSVVRYQTAAQPRTDAQPQQVSQPQPASQPRWRPRSWSGITQLEDIQEIRSQESLEIKLK